ENLVSMAIVGEMFGVAFGCWTNNSFSYDGSCYESCDAPCYNAHGFFFTAFPHSYSLLIIVGASTVYRVNILFAKEPRTWSCMIGEAGILAVVQFMLMWFL
ncbi:hypothetical protein MKW92_051121, partial [Papaver armeniacum]